MMTVKIDLPITIGKDQEGTCMVSKVIASFIYFLSGIAGLYLMATNLILNVDSDTHNSVLPGIPPTHSSSYYLQLSDTVLFCIGCFFLAVSLALLWNQRVKSWTRDL
jgi:hypothetical protein